MFQEILLGLIQGITEWLPVSSSGHLVIFQHFFGMEDNLLLDLMLHIGTLLVVLFMFRKDIQKIAEDLLRAAKLSLKKKSLKPFNEGHAWLSLMVVVGTIPIGIIGIVFKTQVEAAFSSIKAVSIALIITGVILWQGSTTSSRKRVTLIDAVIIGIFQAAAIMPGISRSGSTIAAGVMRGIDRNVAARYSFLLFIPAILGATIVQLDEFTPQADYSAIIAGTLVAMITSYFVIEWLLNIVKKGKLHYFSYYCWTVGIGLLVYSIL